MAQHASSHTKGNTLAKIETLIPDIHKLLLKEKHELSEENLEAFSKDLIHEIKKSFNYSKKPYLRLSNLGLPPRKMWYEINQPDVGTLPDADTRIKFLYGHLIEQLIVLLIKESGHKVSDQQKKVKINGVKGHLDLKIDGETTDIKSASPFGFKKFSEGTLPQDDTFGYINQLGSYVEAEGEKRGHFLGVNKVTGELALLTLTGPELGLNPGYLVEKAKKVLASATVPEEKCYPAIPSGKSGNMGLGFSCQYCPFKNECWKDSNGGKGIRRFQYSTGVSELVEVKKEPRVEEVLST